MEKSSCDLTIEHQKWNLFSIVRWKKEKIPIKISKPYHFFLIYWEKFSRRGLRPRTPNFSRKIILRQNHLNTFSFLINRFYFIFDFKIRYFCYVSNLYWNKNISDKNTPLGSIGHPPEVKRSRNIPGSWGLGRAAAPTHICKIHTENVHQPPRTILGKY